MELALKRFIIYQLTATLSSSSHSVELRPALWLLLNAVLPVDDDVLLTDYLWNYICNTSGYSGVGTVSRAIQCLTVASIARNSCTNFVALTSRDPVRSIYLLSH